MKKSLLIKSLNFRIPPKNELCLLLNEFCAVLRRLYISTHENSDLLKAKKKTLLSLFTIIVHNFHNSRQVGNWGISMTFSKKSDKDNSAVLNDNKILS